MTKGNTVLRKLKLSDYERRAMAEFDLDLTQSFPEVNVDAPRLRVPLVSEALAGTRPRFQLCREAVKITRATHDSSKHRVPNSINRAFAVLVEAQRKPSSSMGSKPAARAA